MKKVLIMMLLGVSSINVWGQASHTTYKFNNNSDGTLFTNEQGTTPVTYAANDVCNQTYYLKVDYQHTTSPATKNGPKTFDVTDYYVNGVCTYGQEYEENNTYTKVQSSSLITNDNKESYIKNVTTFTEHAATWIYTWNGTTPYDTNKVPVIAGSEVDPNVTYYGGNEYTTNTGTTIIGWGDNNTSKSDIFMSSNDIYTFANGIYTRISSYIYDSRLTYYVVNFTNAPQTEVSAETNFKTSKLVNLNDDSPTLYHKNGTSYNAVSEGDQFFDDGEYYVEGTSYQPYKPEELVSLGYTTATTTYYNCDITKDEENKIYTVTYHLYDNSYSGYKDYIRDCHTDISSYKTLDVKCNDGNQSSTQSLSELFTAVKECNGTVNLVIADFSNYGFNNKDAIDLSNLKDSSIKRIILPDATWSDATILSNVANRDGAGDVYVPIVQAYNTNSSTKNVEIIHSFTAGTFRNIQDAHYYSTNIDNAYWIEINGNINVDDMDFINGIHNDRLNLSQATNSGDEAALRSAMHEFTNDYVKYLAWPVFTTEPTDPLYNDLYTQCEELVAVGQYVVPVNASGNAIADATKLVVCTHEDGDVKYITEMLKPVTNNNVNIRNAKISGNLRAEDIFKGGIDKMVLGADGHMYLSPAVNEYSYDQSRTMGPATEDGETISNGALDACSGLISLDLSDANFSTEHLEDLTLSKLNIISADTKEIKLPNSSDVTEIPADFLNCPNSVHEIMIPSNIKKIHARAFKSSDIMHIWTNTIGEAESDNGATYETDELGTLISYKYTDNKPNEARMVYGTYTFAPTLEFIGSYVFSTSTHIHDVYMLGKKAPVCCADAFSTVSYYANNSYQADAIPTKINRDAYANTKYAWMTMLHFPAECTDDEAKLYTDITRRYSIASDKRDGNGNIVYYPTQCEWNRSFVQASSGYLWNAFCNKRNPYAGSAMAFYQTNAAHQEATAPDGSPEGKPIQASILGDTNKSYSGYQTIANTMYNTNDELESVKSKEVFYDTSAEGFTALPYNTSLYNADYRGWHQFVLAEYGYSDKIVISFEDFYDSNWWTICEPFPLTSAELKKAFGENVKLCKLVSVTRNVAKGGIRLNFGQNLVGTDESNGYTLQAGVPYMIKPALPTDGTTLDQKLAYEVSNTTDNIERFAEKTADELETLLKDNMYTVDAILVNNTGDCKEPEKDGPNGTKIHQNLQYTMMGTFFKYYLPQYCYFLGWDNEYNGPAFFWHDEVADKGNRDWNPYTAVIVPNWIGAGNPFEHPASGEFDTIHYRYSSTGAIGENDDFVVTSSTKRMTLNFVADDDNETTQIQTIHIGNTTYYDGNVYNMNGQLISNDGNLNTLPKGVYIINGKKYISK